MKALGIVRKIDDIGRIVIPIEVRKMNKIHGGDQLEIFVEDDMLILKKYKVSDDVCIVTGNVLEKNDSIKMFDGKITLSKDGANLLVEELIKEIGKK